MPELPEVETTLRGIVPHIIGRRITGVTLYDPRLRWPVPANLPQMLVGRIVDRIDRRSKYLLFRLSHDTLLIHLGMTGSLRVYQQVPQKRAHDHIDISFDNGATLRYHDPRRFGAMLWLPHSNVLHPLLAELGPEPFSPEFNANYLYRATKKRRAAVKLALMDNRLAVGVGNIYANESLFRAGIRPNRPANRISLKRYQRLVDATRDTLYAAITKGGSTLRDYVDSNGLPGDFQLDYYVYGRAGEPCRICGQPVRLIRQGGRATYYCASCQT